MLTTQLYFPDEPRNAADRVFDPALLGTGLLVGVRPGAGADGRFVVGVLFALASALGYAAITICGRLFSREARPLEVNAVALQLAQRAGRGYVYGSCG